MTVQTATNTSKEIAGFLTPENPNCCVRQDMALQGSLLQPLSVVPVSLALAYRNPSQ